jgi:DNA-binding beta-propeller fold protein YncE
MAIDGNIWLLFSDGRLLRFLSGEQPQFALTGVPGGLTGPVALAVPQEGNRMYIADPGSARIVEITKEGQFIRQFKAREGDILKNMVDLFLDEASGMFYILTPDQLFGAYVPDPAQTPGATPANTPTS